jgi:hypothetical protein
MRPSTLLRIERLAALVAAFCVRDLGPAGTATLLRCSGSSARNYVAELLDADVIKPIPAGRGEGCVDKNVYRLNPNRRLVDAFLASLKGCGPGVLTRASQVRRDCHEAHCAGSSGDALAPCGHWPAANLGAGRDPLVTALFGAPGSGKRRHAWRRAVRPATSVFSVLLAHPGQPSRK